MEPPCSALLVPGGSMDGPPPMPPPDMALGGRRFLLLLLLQPPSTRPDRRDDVSGASYLASWQMLLFSGEMPLSWIRLLWRKSFRRLNSLLTSGAIMFCG